LDDANTRPRLAAAWRATRDRLIKAGYEDRIVTETMTLVALAGLAEQRGRLAAADFLQGVLDRLRGEVEGDPGLVEDSGALRFNDPEPPTRRE
jgi:hypothetical protein